MHKLEELYESGSDMRWLWYGSEKGRWLSKEKRRVDMYGNSRTLGNRICVNVAFGGIM